MKLPPDEDYVTGSGPGRMVLIVILLLVLVLACVLAAR